MVMTSLTHPQPPITQQQLDEFATYVAYVPVCKNFYSLSRSRFARQDAYELHCYYITSFAKHLLEGNIEIARRLYQSALKDQINILTLANGSPGQGKTPLLAAVGSEHWSSVTFLVEELPVDVNLAVDAYELTTSQGKIELFCEHNMQVKVRVVTALSLVASAALAAVPFKTDEEWDNARERVGYLLNKGGKISRNPPKASGNQMVYNMRLLALFKACAEGSDAVASIVKENTPLIAHADLVGEYCGLTKDEANARLTRPINLQGLKKLKIPPALTISMSG